MNATPPFVSSRYALLKHLGQGGMGVVYEAIDRVTGTSIALKLVRSTVVQRVEPLPATNAERVALAKEFRTLAALRHPRIINVLDYGFTAADLPYFTMELLKSPRNIFDYSRTLDYVAKTRLLIDLLEGLAYLHRHGIVHRDLKPDNILIDEDSLKLLDFGLASDELVGDLAGTLAYIAPEVFNGRTCSPRSDLYAVGLIGYELYCGAFPYNTKNIAKLMQWIQSGMPDLAVLEAATNAKLATVIGRLLQKDPANRYHDAPSVIAELSAAARLPPYDEDPLIRESFLQAAPFVGREEERDLLEHALHNAQAGRGAVYLIGGESGVGKSRLLEEIRIRALVKGVFVLVGQAAEGDSRPFPAWREPLRLLALSMAFTEMELSILKQIAPDIDALQGTSVALAEPLEGEAYQRRLSATLTEVFTRCSKPLLLLLEDIHWLPESVVAVAQLAWRVARLPVLVIATYRVEEAPDLPARIPAARALRLSRFTTEEIQQLSPMILGDNGCLPQVIDFLEHHTEGNAFFLVETLRALAQATGSLEDIGRTTLPTTIISQRMLEVAARRLSHLPTVDQELMLCAALYGREVDTRFLRQLDPTADLTAWITRGVNIGLLALYEGRPRFSHDKMREGILRLVTPSSDHYRRAAEAVEALYPDHVDYAARLALWWGAAGETAKALRCARVEAHELHRRGEYRATRRLIETTLAGLPPEDFLAERLDLLVTLASALELLSDFAAVEHIAREGFALAERLQAATARVKLLITLGLVKRRSGDFEAGLALLDEARRLHEGCQDDIAVNIWTALAALYYDRQKVAEMLNCADQIAAIAAHLGSEMLLARSYTTRSSACFLQREFGEVADFARRALTIFEKHGDRRGMMRAAQHLTTVYTHHRDYAAAREWGELAVRLCEAMDDLSAMSTTLGNLAYLAAQSGFNEDSESYFQRGIALARQLNNPNTASEQLGALAQVQILLAKWDAAFQTTAQWLAVAQSINNVVAHLHGLYAVVDLALYANQPDAAARWFGTLLAYARPHHQDPDEQAKLRAKMVAVLDGEQVDALVAEGKMMSLEQAMTQVAAFLAAHAPQEPA